MKLRQFVSSLSGGLIASGRFRKLESYRSLLNSLSRFFGDSPFLLVSVFTPRFLRAYEDHLIVSGCMRNTISFYMSTLRSLYGQAVERKLLPFVPDLFSGVFTGVDPTEKRALAPESLACIFTADLSGKPRLEPCRDYLLLSFQLQGMPFVDLAHLRKSDVQGNVICYRRQKTGTLVQVSMLPEAKAIFDKYADEVADSPYLLPLVNLTGGDGYRQYQSVLHRQNRHLKELAAYLGIRENLTSYVARHSWATIAYHNGVEVGVVSQGMGHHTEEITRTYLSSFAQDRLTVANCIVLNALFRPILEGRVPCGCPEMLERIRRRSQCLSEYIAAGEMANMNMGAYSRRIYGGGEVRNKPKSF